MRKKWRCLIRSESYEQYNIEHNPQQEDFFKAVFVDFVIDVSFLKLFLVEGIYFLFLLIWEFHTFPNREILREFFI